MLGGSPSPEQGIGKGDPFAIDDVEEAAAQVWHELAAVLADLGLERATGVEIHCHNLALGRCRNPPLLEAAGVRPRAPNHRPGRLDDARYRQVEIRVYRSHHFWVSSTRSVSTNCWSRSVRPSQVARCSDSHRSTAVNGSSSMAQIRTRPTLRVRIHPLSSSKRMCCMKDGNAMSNGFARSLTLAGPLPNRPNTALRVGSAIAWKMPFNCLVSCSIPATISLENS